MFDRDAVVAAVDLAELADELLGPRTGAPRTPSWRCPRTTHKQTGRTPPLTVFATRRGEQRWHCHGCGAGGTAIDLLMAVRGVDVGEAIRELSRRGGVLKGLGRPVRRRPDQRRSRSTGPRPVGREGPSPLPAIYAVAELRPYVERCAAALWARTRSGAQAREWLIEGRGLPAGILRANDVGVDAGEAEARPDGLPRSRPAIVLPILAADGPAYVQLRVMRPGPDGLRYVNPPSSLVVNPRVGRIRTVGAALHDEVVVAEGVIDALSAAAAGYRAAAVLGAAYPDGLVAGRLARLPHPLIIAFDPDERGKEGADRLVHLLAARHRSASLLHLDPERGDLNATMRTSSDWKAELPDLIAASRALRPTPAVPAL